MATYHFQALVGDQYPINRFGLRVVGLYNPFFTMSVRLNLFAKLCISAYKKNSKTL
jgi:hypothetical protein